jgi:hypothetical protein
LNSCKQTAEAASLADDRQKEIAYLKRALQIVCTRYENAMGERLPAVTEEDHKNQTNHTEGSLQLSKTFEALARKDEEIIELKDEVERLRKETAVGLTPTEEVLSLRGSLKDVMLRVSRSTFSIWLPGFNGIWLSNLILYARMMKYVGTRVADACQ